MSAEHAHPGQAVPRRPRRLHRGREALLAALLTVVLALAVALTATADSGPSQQEDTEVLTFAEQEVVEGATARLVRGDDTLSTRTDTRDLDHGHVMTLWWVVFNNPDECEHGEPPAACGEADLFNDANEAVKPSCVYADGSVVGGNGHARFSDRLAVGEARDSCIDFFVDAEEGLEGEDHGLVDPVGAEVHLVVHSHGPRIPGKVAEQRSTFDGGCDKVLGPGQTELDSGECSDLQFAVFPAAEPE